MKYLAIALLLLTTPIIGQDAKPQKTESSTPDQAPDKKEKDKPAKTKACSPGDNWPAGTIDNGYRKVIEETPFGRACRWVPVQ